MYNLLTWSKTIAGFAGALCLLLLLPTFAVAGGGGTEPFTTTYDIKFEGDWTGADHPGVSLPGNAHFSPLIGAVHGGSVTFWADGQLATPGLEEVAEIGVRTTFRNEINSQIPAKALSLLDWTSGNIDNTGTATFSAVAVNQSFPLVSLATMIAPSHDWFVGVSGVSLLDNDGRWKDQVPVTLFPYDAGTEEGTDFSLTPSVTTDPQETIAGISGLSPFNTNPLGTLTFTRINFSDVNISKSVEPQVDIEAQQAVTYTIVLSNGGDTAAIGAVMTDGLPTGTIFARWVEQPAGAGESGGVISWNGTVPTPTNVIFTYVTTYTGAISGGAVVNAAQLSHTSENGVQSGQAVVTFTVKAGAGGSMVNLYLPTLLK